MHPLASGSCEVARCTAGERTWIRKTFPSDRGFRQELVALRRLYPERILDVRDADRTLHLVDLPGCVPEASREVHRAAGRWLRWLHDQPLDDDDPLPIGVALNARAAALSRPPAVDFSGVQGRRVLCHRDFRPANWLWDDGLVVLDFEHTRADHPLWDLLKLADEVWPARPDLREAFLETYGPVDDDLLGRMLLLFRAQTEARR